MIELAGGCPPETSGSLSSDSGTLSSSPHSVDYTLGNCGPATERITVTVTGSGGDATDYIDVTYW